MGLSNKSEKIVERGIAERGTFEPHGTPLKIYNYWRENTEGRVPVTENFCHYWRVVAIWGPLTWVGKKIEGFLGVHGHKVAALIVASIITLFTVLAVVFNPGFVLIYVVPYLLIGILMAGFLRSENDTWRDWIDPDESVNDQRWSKFLFPAVLFGWGVTATVIGIAHFLASAGHKIAETARKISVPKWLPILGGWILGLLALAALVGVTVLAIMDFGFGTVALSIGGMALGIGSVMLIGEMLSRIIKRRRDAKWALYDAYVEQNYDYSWEAPSFRKFNEKTGGGKLRRAGRAVKEFFILLWNVVRVNKWKICPIVKID